jgi:hypothetical protein
VKYSLTWSNGFRRVKFGKAVIYAGGEPDIRPTANRDKTGPKISALADW